MQKRLRLALLACAIGACAGAAWAEAPAKPVWSIPVGPDQSYKLGFQSALALHADGSALLAVEQQRGEGNDTAARLLVVSVGADGRLLQRSAPVSEPQKYVRGAYLAPDRDGFALLTNRETDYLVVYRLEREGRVRAIHRLRFRGEPMQEINGLAADGKGNIFVFGGAFDGPHSPAMAVIDPAGRMVWSYVSRHGMPPGGVRAGRFRRDGGVDALVIDREKPFWERRSDKGALLARVPLSIGQDCSRFLDGARLLHIFYNHEERPDVKAPAKHLVAMVHGPDGKLGAAARVIDLGAKEDFQYCKLAVAPSGWFAVTGSSTAKILVFDDKLAPRGEIDLAPQGVSEVEALAIDAAGAVTALGELRSADRRDRKMILLRYAAPAR